MFILEEFLVVVMITPAMVLETVIVILGCFFSTQLLWLDFSQFFRVSFFLLNLYVVPRS